jgi:hypothetical protein
MWKIDFYLRKVGNLDGLDPKVLSKLLGPTKYRVSEEFMILGLHYEDLSVLSKLCFTTF